MVALTVPSEARLALKANPNMLPAARMPAQERAAVHVVCLALMLFIRVSRLEPKAAPRLVTCVEER